MAIRVRFVVAFLLTPSAHLAADNVLYRYEGEVSPCDPSAGWICGNPCEAPCTEFLENGHYVLRWEEYSELANYNLWIARPEDPPPPSTLWVKWRFRSNNPIPPTDFGCDANFKVKYGGMFELVFMFADAAVSFSGDLFITGLDSNEFHTFRYESLDGMNYTIAVDGRVFIVDADQKKP